MKQKRIKFESTEAAVQKQPTRYSVSVKYFDDQTI